jgi:hypothetical protein
MMKKRTLALVSLLCFALSLLTVQSSGQTVQNIPGLRAWYRSDTGVVLSNNLVSSWQDLGPNAYHTTQSQVPKQPAYLPSALNGHPAISFDGQDVLKGPVFAGFDTASYSIFVVASGDTMTDDFNVLLDFGSFAPGGMWLCRYSQSTAQ